MSVCVPSWIWDQVGRGTRVRVGFFKTEMKRLTVNDDGFGLIGRISVTQRESVNMDKNSKNI